MMVPTRTSNTGSNRVSWIVVIVVSGLVSRTACMDMHSMACVGSNNCKLELNCENERIWLLDQEYVYRIHNSEIQCTETFSKEHAYHLYQECSGLKSCSVEARSGNFTCDTIGTTVSADSNIVNYKCIKGDDTVQLCKGKTVEKEVVNIYFNDGVEMEYNNQMCKCTIKANDYSVTMEDIRPLRPCVTSRCSSAIIDNFDKKCNDSNKVWDNFVYRKLWNTTTDVITVKHLFAQGEEDRPTMIWIRVKSQTHENVHVVCEGAVKGKMTPTVGSPLTTKPSSGSATSTTTKPSIAAIVVPLLLVLLGSAAAVTSVWFWRKRRKAATEKNTNISNGQENVTPGMSSGVSSGRISGTDRTYDLPEQDEYSTTDGNGLANSSCELDNYGYIVPAVAMRADDTPEYEVPVHVDGGEEHTYSILDKVDRH